jgi:hypothetical protein
MNRYISHFLVGLLVALALAAPATAGDGAFKMGGAWVARVQEEGVPFAGQWTYVVTADPSGRRAAGYGSIDSGLNVEKMMPGVFEERDYDSPILVEIVMTGPRTASYYSIWYGLKNLDPDQPITRIVTMIGVVTGELEFVEQGKIVGTHDFALYRPEQDADGDGFPDEGQTTPYVFQLTTIDTRLPAPE